MSEHAEASDSTGTAAARQTEGMEGTVKLASKRSDTRASLSQSAGRKQHASHVCTGTRCWHTPLVVHCSGQIVLRCCRLVVLRPCSGEGQPFKVARAVAELLLPSDEGLNLEGAEAGIPVSFSAEALHALLVPSALQLSARGLGEMICHLHMTSAISDARFSAACNSLVDGMWLRDAAAGNRAHTREFGGMSSDLQCAVVAQCLSVDQLRSNFAGTLARFPGGLSALRAAACDAATWAPAGAIMRPVIALNMAQDCAAAIATLGQAAAPDAVYGVQLQSASSQNTSGIGALTS